MSKDTKAIVVTILVAAFILAGGLMFAFGGSNGDGQGAAGGRYLENYIPVVRYNGGMATQLPFDMDGTSAILTVGGALNISGATTLSGSLTYLEGGENASTSADRTLTVAESGITIYVAAGLEATTTLPAVAIATGTVYRFVVTGVLTGDPRVVLSAEGDNIDGNLTVNGALVDCVAEDSVQFPATNDLGNFIELRSDGQSWFLLGQGVAAGKITCDDPS